MAYPLAWLILGAVISVLGGVWLRRKRDAFIAELAARNDPLADAPRDRVFRRAFQNWLLGVGRPEGADIFGSTVFVLTGTAALIALGIWSFAGVFS